MGGSVSTGKVDLAISKRLSFATADTIIAGAACESRGSRIENEVVRDSGVHILPQVEYYVIMPDVLFK